LFRIALPAGGDRVEVGVPAAADDAGGGPAAPGGGAPGGSPKVAPDEPARLATEITPDPS